MSTKNYLLPINILLDKYPSYCQTVVNLMYLQIPTRLQSEDNMASKCTIEQQLQVILNDSNQKRVAAKQVAARIREVSKLAKATLSRTARREYYNRKIRLIEWALSIFSEYNRVLSFEHDQHLGLVVVVRLADGSAVHAPLKNFNARNLIDLNKLPYRTTLKPDRLAKPVALTAQLSFN
jgi:hypothetical protein